MGIRGGDFLSLKRPPPPTPSYESATDTNYSWIKEHEATEKLCLELESIKSGAMFTACLPERI